jgi:hypothetical protein
MSQAMRRFEDLRRKFRSEIRSRKLSSVQRHHLLWAASLWQVSEQSLAAMIAGAAHDRGLINRLQAESRTHLQLAGARPLS